MVYPSAVIWRLGEICVYGSNAGGWGLRPSDLAVRGEVTVRTLCLTGGEEIVWELAIS